MRQAASVTRTLTYPRRGLHGEVVHLIGLQIMSGELKPGDPLPPEDELIPISRSAAPCCGRRCACSRRRDSWRRGPRTGRVFGLAPNGTSSIPTSSAGAPKRPTTAGCTRRRPKCGWRSSRSPRDWRRRGPQRTRPPGSSRRTPTWRPASRSGCIPRCRPSLPRSDPRLVPQRTARSPRCRPSGGAPHDLELTMTPPWSRRRALPLHKAIIDNIAAGTGTVRRQRRRRSSPTPRRTSAVSPAGTSGARSAAPRARTSQSAPVRRRGAFRCGVDDAARRHRVPTKPVPVVRDEP